MKANFNCPFHLGTHSIRLAVAAPQSANPRADTGCTRGCHSGAGSVPVARSPLPAAQARPLAAGPCAEGPGPAGSCRRGRTAAPGAPRAGRGQRCGSGGAGAEPPRPLCVRGRGSVAAAILCRPGSCLPGLRGAAPGPRSCTEGPSGASPRSPARGPSRGCRSAPSAGRVASGARPPRPAPSPRPSPSADAAAGAAPARAAGVAAGAARAAPREAGARRARSIRRARPGPAEPPPPLPAPSGERQETRPGRQRAGPPLQRHEDQGCQEAV